MNYDNSSPSVKMDNYKKRILPLAIKLPQQQQVALNQNYLDPIGIVTNCKFINNQPKESQCNYRPNNNRNGICYSHSHNRYSSNHNNATIITTMETNPVKLLSGTVNQSVMLLLLALLIASELPFYQHLTDIGSVLHYHQNVSSIFTSKHNFMANTDGALIDLTILSTIILSNQHHQTKWFSFRSAVVGADWDSWWTYEGISGPDFWGRLNPKWSHCSKGKRQSPINIDTEHIIYDSYLREITIKGENLDGYLENTGRSISVTVNKDKLVLLSGGPLSYQYTLSNVTLHFGRENNRGSEHTINGVQFAGELQMYAFNGQLYSNWSEARRSPNGLAAISALIKLTKNSMAANSQLKMIANSLKNISNRGDIQEIQSLSIRELLPDIRQYVTYDGSLTQPACFETVQWIVLNKPIYMSAHQFHLLRNSLKGDGHQDNFRPIQELNHRAIRSNIINNQHHQRHNRPPSSSSSSSGSDGYSFNSENRYKYKLDHSSEENTDPLSSSSQSFSFSKELCYVSRPVAYKINQNQMDIDI